MDLALFDFKSEAFWGIFLERVFSLRVPPENSLHRIYMNDLVRLGNVFGYSGEVLRDEKDIVSGAFALLERYSGNPQGILCIGGRERPHIARNKILIFGRDIIPHADGNYSVHLWTPAENDPLFRRLSQVQDS